MSGQTAVGPGRDTITVTAEPIAAAFFPVPSWPEDGPSAIEQLLQILDTHVRTEAESLSTYFALAGSLEDPVAQVLLQLLTEDEDRHHKLLRRMAETLRDTLYWTHSVEALPTGSPAASSRTAENIAALKLLIAQEHDSSEHFRRLAQDCLKVSDGLFALLLDMMAGDSDRHARTLRFLQQRLGEPQGSR